MKHSVGAATLLGKHANEHTKSLQKTLKTNLIHILAKHDTNMNASNTVRGFVPAKLSTRVINTRSMLVFDSAEEMVKPPMRSMIVGENMVENMNL